MACLSHVTTDLSYCWLPRRHRNQALLLGAESSLLPCRGPRISVPSVKLFPSSATWKAWHVHILCKNVGRAHWPTSWELPLPRLDQCFNSGLWRGSWLVRGLSSEWPTALKTTSVRVPVAGYSEWATFWAHCPLGLYSISSQLGQKSSSQPRSWRMPTESRLLVVCKGFVFTDCESRGRV